MAHSIALRRLNGSRGRPVQFCPPALAKAVQFEMRRSLTHERQVGETPAAAHVDRIRIVIPPRTYVYRVESLRVVTPEDTNVLESKGVDELTLVTCYPFRFIGPAPDRYIISAVRVN